MPTPRELVAQLDTERFHLLISASPKKFREEIFRRAGIKAKGDVFSLKSSGKNEVRTQKLHSALKEGLDLGENVVEELIRNYLFTLRPMLADALDHFDVPHDNGLTDHELDFIEKLDPAKGRELRDKLAAKYDGHDVDLYFGFMNIPCA
ncbi:hypothetical protein L6R52_08095 [Myxococcota bacterium]|nr:hypothetical protein [Myxococcota bacterium]